MKNWKQYLIYLPLIIIVLFFALKIQNFLAGMIIGNGFKTGDIIGGWFVSLWITALLYFICSAIGRHLSKKIQKTYARILSGIYWAVYILSGLVFILITVFFIIGLKENVFLPWFKS